MTKIGSLVVLMLAVLALAGSAWGAKSVVTGYSNAGSDAQAQVDLSGGAVAGDISQVGGTQVTSSSLPFTGLDLGLIAAGAAGLLAVGFLLRRNSRPQDDRH